MTRTSALRLLFIAAISFFTLVDLFATQAILPSLSRAYGVSAAVMGSAVNACTIGMAIAGIAVAWFNRRIDRRIGVVVSLALLAIPTVLLSRMPDLATFTALRVVQGLCMSAAFSLTISYLAENCSAEEAAGALAAYVTGNVASNLFGRLMSAAVADHFSLASNFLFFAALNLAGAALAYFVLTGAMRPAGSRSGAPAMALPGPGLIARGDLLSCFAIGFLILFTFIGTFTYVNFYLTGTIGLSAMQLGFVYFVFVPSIIATPFAGRAARRFGPRRTILAAFLVAAAGLPLLAMTQLVMVLAGLALVGAGTFFAQATATGYVSRNAGEHRGSAGGIYLSSYYLGGLAGSIILGTVYDGLGWRATLLAIAMSFTLAALLTARLRQEPSVLPVGQGVASHM
jgi:predicted MFS family arabinose efflux permease